MYPENVSTAPGQDFEHLILWSIKSLQHSSSYYFFNMKLFMHLKFMPQFSRAQSYRKNQGIFTDRHGGLMKACRNNLKDI